MLIFRPTSRLRKEAGIPDGDLVQIEDSLEGFGTWYAELIRIGHEKIVLFLNSKTLYPIVARSLDRKAIRDLHTVFLDRLEAVLKEEGVELELYRRVTAGFGEVRFSKTVNRSIVGSMNDMAKHLVWSIEDELRDVAKDEMSLSKRLSGMPMSAIGIGMGFPNHAFSEILQTEFGWTREFRSVRYARPVLLPADSIHPMPRAVVRITMPERDLILGSASLSKESRACLEVPEGTRNFFQFELSEAEISPLLQDLAALKSSLADRKLQIRAEQVISTLHRARFELKRAIVSEDGEEGAVRRHLRLVTWH